MVTKFLAWFSLEGNKSQMSISNSLGENPWASANASNMESPTDAGWADFSSFPTSFPEEKQQALINEVDHSGDKNSKETSPTITLTQSIGKYINILQSVEYTCGQNSYTQAVLS